jgi:arginine/ornithine N-succinyltransferase beta subunit
MAILPTIAPTSVRVSQSGFPVSLRATAEQVVISTSIAEALQLNEGDFVRLVQN